MGGCKGTHLQINSNSHLHAFNMGVITCSQGGQQNCS